MGVKLLEKVINSYNDKDVRDFLIHPNSRSPVYSQNIPIVTSIENIVNTALRGADDKNESCLESVKNSDTFIFPDVHGRLDLFLQNLYVAGLIDKSGNWFGGTKTGVLLGDLIHLGPYSTETLIYARTLQEQAKESGGRFELLLGNHEHCLLNDVQIRGFSNLNNTEIVKKIIAENIENGNTKVAYADNDRNIFCVHAGVEKEILKWAISELRPALAPLLSPEKRSSSQEISIMMQENNIKLTDISEWMNIGMKNDLSWNAPLLTEYPSDTSPQGIINSRKKDRTADKQDISKDKILKMTQFVGHTTTSYAPNLVNATFFGAVKKINHNFYTDYDLMRGNRGFVALDGSKVYQVAATKNNGLDKNLIPLQTLDMETTSTLMAHPEVVPGISKELNIEDYSEKHIATLPGKETRLAEAERIRNKIQKPAKSNMACGIFKFFG